jgi:hypothetical protein
MGMDVGTMGTPFGVEVGVFVECTGMVMGFLGVMGMVSLVSVRGLDFDECFLGVMGIVSLVSVRGFGFDGCFLGCGLAMGVSFRVRVGA